MHHNLPVRHMGTESSTEIGVIVVGEVGFIDVHDSCVVGGARNPGP